MHNQPIPPILPEFIRQAIDSAIAKATEEELERAKERIEKRKAEVIAGIILFISKEMKIENMGEYLTITVRTPK